MMYKNFNAVPAVDTFNIQGGSWVLIIHGITVEVEFHVLLLITPNEFIGSRLLISAGLYPLIIITVKRNNG